MYFDPDWIFKQKPDDRYPNITGLMDDKPKPKKKKAEAVNSMADVFRGPDKPPFSEYYNTVPQQKSDTATYSLEDAYNELPYRQMKRFAEKPNAHLPDTFKKPTHPTFSDESKYHSAETPGGHWDYQKRAGGEYWQFTPSQYNIDNMGGIDAYIKWWNETQPDNYELNINSHLYRPIKMDDKPKPKKKKAEAVNSMADVFRGPRVEYAPPKVQLEQPDITPIDTRQLNRQTSQINYRDLQQKRAQYLEDYKNRLVYIQDNRTLHPITKQPLNPNRDLYSSYYDPNSIKNIFLAAQKVGVDPYEALAIAMQETKIGRFRQKSEITSTNIGHVIDPEFRDVINTYDRLALALQKANNTYKDRYKEAGITYDPTEDAARRLQIYNGLGILTPRTESGYHGGTVNSFYGIPVTKEATLDMSKDPIYGKVILDLVQSLQNQPAIQDIYKQVYTN